MKNILLDKDTILDAYLPNRPEHAYAYTLIDCLQYGEANAHVTSLTLKDVYCILCKLVEEKESRNSVFWITKYMNVLCVDDFIINEAIQSNEPNLEDGIIRSCAETNNIDFIISRNVEAYKKSRVKRMSAKEFLTEIMDVQEVEF